ncbi:unnamed protein product [Leptidea sinapis]|uniref:MutL C-terminal dimerisation domain-containing protein n=1 Tax=Leptidea sinapis TaxID=189913 RepID=A0A5E4QS38_9NEOP|nr:unnamed protein product [Leptidea sinapis]
MCGKISNTTYSNFLVLFDQHAVDERVRLERNLVDYFDGISWKSVSIDVVSFQISQEDLIFLLNNYDKLTKFGLQWSVADNVISINGIPEAILGKNPRQADLILKAAKHLLVELIDCMKYAKGNIPLYPKSIMELVFSEACRYAVKFGDTLSKDNCVSLIKALATCKSPFQCAHGRPVNLEKVTRWKKCE